MKNIAVFASHGGSNLQAIIDATKSGQLNARVCAVLSNNSKAYALERARSANIPAYHISRKTHPSNMEEVLLQTLINHNTDIIFLAGFLKKISPEIIKAYEGSIYNIHPALLPRHGGLGFHGLNVHKAVLESGDTETGVTIHRVNHEYDEGDIVAQKTVQVLPGDTPESLAARVLEAEHGFIVDFLQGLV